MDVLKPRDLAPVDDRGSVFGRGVWRLATECTPEERAAHLQHQVALEVRREGIKRCAKAAGRTVVHVSRVVNGHVWASVVDLERLLAETGLRTWPNISRAT